ncbi:MAG: ribonuclease III [Pyrinomonadaceae bacterium]|nr:ribonuclease III [Pyrinomonadaceae bacterium]
MELEQLENAIGHRFRDPLLLERALTHRSWAHEELPGRAEAEIRASDNETLEFLGDSVLGMAIAEELFRRNPEMNEGHLTLMKHRLVSMDTLAEVAVSISLGDAVRVGRGEEMTGGRKKKALLSNTVEAVIAAIFLDAGYDAARDAIYRLFDGHLREATPQSSLDYKTLLQETLQAAKLSAPAYTLVGSDGPPHERTFFVEASWEGGTARGEGRSIKAAEMSAASEALKQLSGTESPGQDV